MEKLIYQMFILGCGALEESLAKGLGGVIFFTKDITSIAQFKELINEIKKSSIITPFLSIDQEGGKVERTENIHERYLSQRFALEKGVDFLRKQSEKIAIELADYGINLNFSPCIDVNTNPNNPIIGERAFSDNTDAVIKGMEIVISEFRNKNIIPCVKHYPGHGDADKDSHLTLPKIDLPFEEMREVHIKPFEAAIRNNIEMIMVAHLHCTCFDREEIPSSMSKNAISYLRENLKYNGVTVSDDMVMNGVKIYEPLEGCVKGILAGLDMFIYRDSKEETINIIENLIKEVKSSQTLKRRVEESYERILNLKKRYRIL